MTECASSSALFTQNSTFSTTIKSTVASFNNHYKVLHGFLALAFCIFGMVANFMHVKVLTCRALRSHAINVILAAIALCDFGTAASYAVYISKFGNLGGEDSCVYHRYTTGMIKTSNKLAFPSICFDDNNVLLALSKVVIFVTK